MHFKLFIGSFIFFTFPAVYSQVPVLDTRFGSNGKTVTSFFSPGYSNGQKIVLRPDSGFYIIGSAAPKQNYHMAVASYLRSGILDTAFGDQGKAILPFSDGSLRDHAICYYLEDDGLILGGYATIESGEVVLALQKMLENGGLDPKWGNKGRVSQIFGYTAWVLGIYKTVDKGFAVIGSSGIESNKPGLVVLKLDTAGQIDATFGDNGVREIRTSWPLEALSSVSDTFGNIYLAGQYRHTRRPFILRLGKDLHLDSLYGSQGYAVFGDTLSGKIVCLAMQSDQKLLASGHTELFEKPVAAVYRFFMNGIPDNLFDGSGRFVISQSNTADYGRAVICAPDKSIYMVNMPLGELQNGSTSIVKLDSSGKKDALFGNLGTFMRQFGNRADNPTDVQIDASNGLLVAGSVQTYSTLSGFYVVRFITDATAAKADLTRSASPFLFPNPSTGILNVKYIGPNMKIHIRDGSGRLVYQSEINVAQGENGWISLPTGIQPGMYFVEWGNSEQHYSQTVTFVSE